MNSNPDRRLVIVAFLVASVLMLAFGLSYRVLAARLNGPVTAAPISPEAVAQFPTRIGNWEGEEVPIDEAIVRATDTDAHISRRYTARGGLDAVSLYVACGVRLRDLMPHRPEVCYTGAGWTVMDHDTAELPVPDGNDLPCSVYQFSRGVLRAERILVLYYYFVDGQYCRDVSLLRSTAWRGATQADYVAQIQIMTPITSTSDAQDARRRASAFAVDSAHAIADLFEDPSTLHSLDEPNDTPTQQ